jgi:hypothetical protein
MQKQRQQQQQQQRRRRLQQHQEEEEGGMAGEATFHSCHGWTLRVPYVTHKQMNIHLELFG